MKKLSVKTAFLLAVLFCITALVGCSGQATYYNLDTAKRISLFQRYPVPEELSQELNDYVMTRSIEALRTPEAELDAFTATTYTYLVDKVRAYYDARLTTPDGLTTDERTLFLQIRALFQSSMQNTNDLFVLHSAATLYRRIAEQTAGSLLSEKLSALLALLPQANAVNYNTENKGKLLTLLQETTTALFTATTSAEVTDVAADVTAKLAALPTLKEAPSAGIRYDFLRTNNYRYSTKEEILQRLTALKTCEINGIVLDCMWDNNRTAYYATTRDATSKHTQVLERFLSAAQELNMTVFIGLSDHELFHNAQLPTDEWLEEQMTRNEITAKEIYETYYATYADTIAGWYFPYEIPSLHPTQSHDASADVKTLRSGIESLKTYFTLLDPDLPLLLTPVYADDNKSTQYSIESQWRTLAEQTGLKETDIVIPNDNFLKSSAIYNTHSLLLANRYFIGYARGLKAQKPQLGATLNLVETEHKPTTERIASQITLAKQFGDHVFTRHFSETLDGTLQMQEYLTFLRIPNLYAFDFSFLEPSDNSL